MMWEPLSEDDLHYMIEVAEAAMKPPLVRFWHQIRIRPEKWQLSPWGDAGGGFWVVAVVGSHCLWYNDIEYGFNASRWRVPGRILDYWCNQPGLEDCVRSYFESFLRDVGCL